MGDSTCTASPTEPPNDRRMRPNAQQIPSFKGSFFSAATWWSTRGFWRWWPGSQRLRPWLSVGVPPQQPSNVIDGEPLGLAYAHLKGEAMIERSFEPCLPAGECRKDAALVASTAKASVSSCA